MTLTLAEHPRAARRTASLQMTALSVFGLLLVVVVLGTQPSFTPVVGAAFLNGLAFWFAVRRLSPFALSPPFLLGSYMTAIAVAGFFFSNALVGSGGTGGVDITLPSEYLTATASRMLLGSSLVLFAGALVGGGTQPGDFQLRGSLGGLGRFAAPIVAFGYLHFTALIVMLGPGNYLERPGRLVGRTSSFEAVGQMLAVGMVLALGIVIFSKRGPVRVLAIVLLSLYGSYFFSLGSRRLALVPILLLVGSVVAGGRLRLWLTAVVAVISPALLALPLYFRAQHSHGLLPYVASLPGFGVDSDNYRTSLNNILAGFKITALTGFNEPQIPVGHLLISVNPLPGTLAGWYQIAPTMRLNRFTPYSALGEIINYGGVVSVGAFFAIGLALGLIHRMNAKLLSGPVTKFVGLVVLGLIVVFTVQTGQYNLRSDARYLYLVIGLQVVTLTATQLRRPRVTSSPR